MSACRADGKAHERFRVAIKRRIKGVWTDGYEVMCKKCGLVLEPWRKNG